MEVYKERWTMNELTYTVPTLQARLFLEETSHRGGSSTTKRRHTSDGSPFHVSAVTISPPTCLPLWYKNRICIRLKTGHGSHMGRQLSRHNLFFFKRYILTYFLMFLGFLSKLCPRKHWLCGHYWFQGGNV